MRRNTVRFLTVILVIALFTGSVFAAYIPGESINATPRPRMTVVGSTATCMVNLSAPGQFIDATLELKQGSTVVASWSGTGTGTLTLSGTATVVNGFTYTLTVSGTINGVAFAPASITKTP